MNRFRDRTDAGTQLAVALRSHAKDEPLVLALPRGGVPIGYEVARALQAPLDVWVVGKLSVPWHPELAIGAVAEGGFVYLDHDILGPVGLSKPALSHLIHVKQHEVEHRVRLFRGDRPPPTLAHRSVIVVDDGIATGATARAALQSIQAQRPKRLTLAVPVAAPDAIQELVSEVDEFECLQTPPHLYAVAMWYRDFSQVSNDEVIALLERSRAADTPPPAQADSPAPRA